MSYQPSTGLSGISSTLPAAPLLLGSYRPAPVKKVVAADKQTKTVNTIKVKVAK